jgi:hypothetical protein
MLVVFKTGLEMFWKALSRPYNKNVVKKKYIFEEVILGPRN